MIKESPAENDNNAVAQWPCSTSVFVLSFRIEAQFSKIRLCFYRGSSFDDILPGSCPSRHPGWRGRVFRWCDGEGEAQRALKPSLLAYNSLPGSSMGGSHWQWVGGGWGVKVQGPAWSLMVSWQRSLSLHLTGRFQ